MPKSTSLGRVIILDALLAAAIVVLVFVITAFAQVKYVDAEGVTHYAGSIEQAVTLDLTRRKA